MTTGIDIIEDLAERAQLIIDETHKSAGEAVSEAIDEGLIYSKEILALLAYYGSIKESKIINSYYERLFEDIIKRVDEYDEDEEEIDDEEELDNE